MWLKRELHDQVIQWGNVCITRDDRQYTQVTDSTIALETAYKGTGGFGKETFQGRCTVLFIEKARGTRPAVLGASFSGALSLLTTRNARELSGTKAVGETKGSDINNPILALQSNGRGKKV